MKTKTSSIGSRDPFRHQMRSRGYSLVELLVVLTVIALLTAAGAATLGRRSQTADLKLTVAQFSADLRLARSLAQEMRRPVAVLIDPTGRQWRLDDRAGSMIPSGVSIELRPIVQGAGITFFPDGSSTGGEVTFRAGELASAVEIDWLSGRVRWDRPF